MKTSSSQVRRVAQIVVVLSLLLSGSTVSMLACAVGILGVVNERIGCEAAPVISDLRIPEVKPNYDADPIEYKLILHTEYVLSFYAEKFMFDVNGELSLELALPKGIDSVGSTKWSGTIKRYTMNVTIRPTMEGNHTVEGVARNLANHYRSRARIMLRVFADAKLLAESTVSRVVYALTTIADTSPDVTARNKSIAQGEAPANYAHVYGVACTYPYSDGKKYMLRGIRVELFERTLGDFKLKTVYTVEASNDGDYGLTPSNYIEGSTWYHIDNSGYFDFGNVYVGSSKTLFFRLVFVFHDGGDGVSEGGTQKLEIKDHSKLLDPTFYVEYSTFTAYSGQESGIWRLEAPGLGSSGGEDEAAHVYYDATKTYTYFKKLVGYPHASINTYIDLTSSSSPYCGGSWPGNGHILYNRWNGYLTYERTDSIVHEYSHSIHYHMRGGSFPPYHSGDSNHGGHNNHCSSDAVTEGWARFLPTVINKDSVYHWADAFGTDISPDLSCPTCGTCDRDEWTFGSCLWDVRDTAGGSHTGFDRIADTMNWRDPDYVRSFFDSFISDWASQISNLRQSLWQVFKNHGINYDSTAPNNPTSLYSTSHSIQVWSTDNTIDVVWSGATDDLSGISGYSIVWDSSPSTIPDNVVDQTVTYSTSFPLSTGSSWYFHLRTKDNAGNWNSVTMHLGPFYIDQAPPGTPSPSETHCGSAWTSHNSPYFTWNNPGDSGSGVSFYEGSIDGGTPFSVSSGYHPTWSDGTRRFKVRAVDQAGNRGSWSNEITVKIDATPPLGSVSINSGATYATSTSVTLTLSAVDGSGSGVVYMCFSNDGSSWSAWENYGTSKSWTLSAGDGTKTVYVKYRTMSTSNHQ